MEKAKEKWEDADLEVIELEDDDIVTTSFNCGDILNPK